MLAENSHRNKQNLARSDPHAKETPGLLPSTIAILKQEIASLQKEKLSIEKEWVKEVNLLKLQINEYKKKLTVLTDKYLIETFTKQKNSQSINNSKDYESLLREKEIVNEHSKEQRKKLEDEMRCWVDQNNKLKKEVNMLKFEKQKCMEISLIEKIDLQQKNRLLQEQIKSKKNIINSLKKQLDKIYSQKEQMNKKERVLQQKTKELDCYSKEISEYNKLNEIRMKQQITQLTKENQFLKEYVKKIEKLAKKECDCEMKEQKVRQNMYQIRRQLTLAKVKLNQQYQLQAKSKKKIISLQSSDNDSNYSFDQKRK